MLVKNLWVISFNHHLQSGLCLNRVFIGVVLYSLSYVKARFVLLVMILGRYIHSLMFNLKWVTWYKLIYSRGSRWGWLPLDWCNYVYSDLLLYFMV